MTAKRKRTGKDQKARAWTAEEDAVVRDLAGREVSYEEHTRRLPRRLRMAIGMRCRGLDLPLPTWGPIPLSEGRFAKHPARPKLLRLFREAAEAGRPCPKIVDTMGALDISHEVQRMLMHLLVEQKAFLIEYRGQNIRRVVFPDGIATDWSDTAPPTVHPGSALRIDAPKWETEEARAIFAGVRFDDAPVRRDLRRFNRPATRVLTGVTGAWA